MREKLLWRWRTRNRWFPVAPLRGAPPCNLFLSRLRIPMHSDRKKLQKNICIVLNLSVSVSLDRETTTTDCTSWSLNHAEIRFPTKSQIDSFLFQMEFFWATWEAYLLLANVSRRFFQTLKEAVHQKSHAQKMALLRFYLRVDAS